MMITKIYYWHIGQS